MRYRNRGRRFKHRSNGRGPQSRSNGSESIRIRPTFSNDRPRNNFKNYQSAEKLAEKYDMKLKVTDFKPLITFKLDYGDKNSLLYTLFIQEMLKRGYLAASSIYLSFAHNEDIIKDYLFNVDEVFSIMTQAIRDDTISSLLETKPKEDGFKRLN